MRLDVPPKVRVFIWRLCSGALPTNKGLHKRVESISPICGRCLKGEESSLHAVWECSFVRGVWEECGVGEVINCLRVGYVVDWVSWWLHHCKEEEKEEISMVAWNVWNERNGVIHGKVPRHPAEVVAAATSLLAAYTRTRDEKGVMKGDVGRARDDAKWKPLGVNYLKINVDGETFKEVGVGMGVVIRDHEGNVVRVACQQVQHKWEANVTKAKSIILGLKMAL